MSLTEFLSIFTYTLNTQNFHKAVEISAMQNYQLFLWRKDFKKKSKFYKKANSLAPKSTRNLFLMKTRVIWEWSESSLFDQCSKDKTPEILAIPKASSFHICFRLFWLLNLYTVIILCIKYQKYPCWFVIYLRVPTYSCTSLGWEDILWGGLVHQCTSWTIIPIYR